MINRRTFLSNAARGTAGTMFLAALNQTPFCAAPRKLDKIGLQLYTVRDQMKEDFDGTLAKVASIGYREVEFAGYFDRTPQQVRAALTANGLAAPSTHIPINMLRGDLNKAIGTAKAIGHEYVVCPYLDASERKTLDQYRQHAALFNKAGQACREVGLQFAYHNHDFEFVTMDGKMPFDLLLAETDPKLVKIELDLYWITRAGHDPLAYFDKHPGRFALFHVKDMDNTPKKFFTEVGRGTIDFKKIFAQSKKAGVTHYFVEQDQCPGSPFDSIKISFDNLRQMTF